MADYSEAGIYARAIYDALRADVGPETIPEWDDLSERARETYRRQAEHVRTAVSVVAVSEEVGRVFRGPDGMIYLVSVGHVLAPTDLPTGSVELVPATETPRSRVVALQCARCHRTLDDGAPFRSRLVGYTGSGTPITEPVCCDCEEAPRE